MLLTFEARADYLLYRILEITAEAGIPKKLPFVFFPPRAFFILLLTSLILLTLIIGAMPELILTPFRML